MTPDGEFRAARFQAGGFRLPWPTKVFLAAIAVSLVAGVVASFALLIYLALLLIPVALVVGAVGYVALRVQAFRARGTRTVARF